MTLGMMLLAWVMWPQTALEVAYLQRRCVLPTTEFVLQWRHSVERQLWQEHYRVREQQLYLDRSLMQTFGAGTPSTGRLLPDAPPGFVGFATTMVLPDLHWVVSRTMQGRIISGQQQWAIAQSVPDLTEIHIQPVFKPRLSLWLEESCYEF